MPGFPVHHQLLDVSEASNSQPRLKNGSINSLEPEKKTDKDTHTHTQTLKVYDKIHLIFCILIIFFVNLKTKLEWSFWTLIPLKNIKRNDLGQEFDSLFAVKVDLF